MARHLQAGRLTGDLGALYHWSPRGRLSSIKSRGLVPGKRNITGPTYHNPDDPSFGEFRADYICSSPDLATAWEYSHAVWGSTGTFDLWQFWLYNTDEVRVLPMWGSRIVEVRIHNRIPKSRLIWIGERTVE